MGSLLYRPEDGEDWRELPETSYENEDELQRLLTKTPQLIPVDDIGGSLVGPLMTVSREAPVAAGMIDVLCLDQRGRPVIIEAKLRKNPEIRREVVSQALSYAAHLEGMSTDEFVETLVQPWVEENHGALEGSSLPEALAQLGHEADRDVEDGLARSLENGRFVILIAVDEPHKQLRRTVSYVNSHADFDLYLVEIGYYRSEDGDEVISPRVLDTSVKQSASKSSRRTFEEILQSASNDVREVDERLVDLADRHGFEIQMTPATRHINTADGIQLLSLAPTREHLSLTLGTMRRVGMGAEADEIQDRLQKLSSVGVSDKQASIPCSDLLDGWEEFETELLPTYVQYRLEAKRRDQAQAARSV